MSKHVIRKAIFKAAPHGRIENIEVSLFEREKGLKDYLLSSDGTLWVESNKGYNSGLFRTRKKADYEFNCKCLEYYVNDELFNAPNRKGEEELAELFPIFANNVGKFEYFNPETKDYLYSIVYLENIKPFDYQIKTISKALGISLSVSKLPDNLLSAYIWEIRPNSAILYKFKYVEDINERSLSHFLWRMVGEKESIFTYPNSKELLMSVLLLNPIGSHSLPSNLTWIDD